MSTDRTAQIRERHIGGHLSGDGPVKPSAVPKGPAPGAQRHLDGDICRINRCGRPLGIGTHVSITGYGRAADQTLPVCEDHWQALRDIFPTEATDGS